MAYSDQTYAVLQGQLYLAPRNLNGALLGGYLFVGDASDVILDPKQKFVDVQESTSGIGLTAMHAPIETDLSFSAKLMIMNKANLVKSLWGTDTGAVAAGTVSAELVQGFNGCMVPLANPGVSAVVVKTAGAATAIAGISLTAGGTGYTANAQLAMSFTGGTGSGAAGYAQTNAAGVVVGVYLTSAGTYTVIPTGVTISGGGSGATLGIVAGNTTLTLNTDYTVDAANGALNITSTSTAISPGSGTALSIAYSYGAYTGKVEAFTTGISYYSARINGVNTANGNAPVIGNIYQIAMNMADKINLLAKAAFDMKLEGKMLQDTTRAFPTAASPFSQFFNIVKA